MRLAARPNECGAAFGLATAFLLLLTGCSPKATARPTEADLHSGDPTSTTPDHPFVCAGHSTLLVDFRNGGFTIVVKPPQGGHRLSLTAPRQGAPFVGSGASAVMEERQLHLAFADGRRLDCVRQSEG